MSRAGTAQGLLPGLKLSISQGTCFPHFSLTWECLEAWALSFLWTQLFEVVVVKVVVVNDVSDDDGSLGFPFQPPAHGLTLAFKSVITVSPLPVLGRADSPAPSLFPFPPSEVSSRHRQSHPPPLCTHSWGSYCHGNGRTNCNLHPYSSSACSARIPPPTWAGGEGGWGRGGVSLLCCCTAVNIHTQPLDLTPNPHVLSPQG